MSLEAIIEAIRDGQCLPFLGAGASAGYSVNGSDVRGIPLGSMLGEKIAAACDYSNGATYDLARIAEYFVFRKSGRRDELENLIKTEIRGVTQPRPIHTALAQLSQVYWVITSNYDELLEMELNRYGRDVTKHFYDMQNPKTAHFRGSIRPKPPSIVLHKMHGTVEQPKSMVITQSDYVHYLTNLNDPDRGMPEFFRKTIIPECNLLFLGYSLEDWDFRVIWEGVLANYRDAGTDLKSYALLKNPSEFQREFWSDRKIKLIDCDLSEFARRLAHEFNLEIPQLGIAKTQPDAPAGTTP
jgi:hypothetical protein